MRVKMSKQPTRTYCKCSRPLPYCNPNGRTTRHGGGRVVRWCWVNFQGQGVLLIWIREGQWPTALAVGAGGGCLDIFLSSIISLFFLPFSGRRPEKTEILSQRAVKPKTTNQPTPRHRKFTQHHRTTRSPLKRSR